jgi:hypothetical protein
MELNDKLPVPERSSFTSPLVTAIDSISGACNGSELGGRDLSAALRRVLEQRVADAECIGTAWVSRRAARSRRSTRSSRRRGCGYTPKGD